MEGVIHVSIRVSDPEASARMFAELIDGDVRPTPLNGWGVVCAYTSNNNENWLVNMLEFWPADKHWSAGKLVEVDPEQQRSYCHVAFLTKKSNSDIIEIGNKYGVLVNEENRGMPTPVPVLYDDLGNYFEFFPASEVRA